MSLVDVIADFKTGVYEVTRKAATTYVRGIATEGATTTFQAEAMVAPLTGRELVRLPEGERANERRLFLTPVELRVSTDAGASDRVSIGGESWEVEDVEDWRELAGFYRCTVRREGR